MMGKAVPEGWAFVELADICMLNPRIEKSEFADDQPVHFVPMASVEALTNRVDVGNVRSFSDVKKGYTPFGENDVIFAKITPCMENGKIAVVPKLQHMIAFGSTEFHVLRPVGSALPLWLFFFVSSHHYRADAEHNMTGAVGQRRVPIDFIARTRLPLPPLNEQKRLVAEIEELFSELDAGVENLKQARAQLGVYRQALLKKAFEGKLTEQWRAQQHPSVFSVYYLDDPDQESTLLKVAESPAAYGRGAYTALNNLPHLKTFRKQLRKKMTPAEARLWTHLKGKQLDGRKFRRQHSVANYILDFYCPEERLAIELDGEVHNNVVASEYDHERDLFLQHTGIKVLRFENRIVFENSTWLLSQIKSHFHTPPDSPPFQGGVAAGRGGSGRGGSGPSQGGVAEPHATYTPTALPTADQLLERIRMERQAHYEQQLTEWRTATADWEKPGKQGKKPPKPRQPKPVAPLSPEQRVGFPSLPEGWLVVRYGDLCSVVRNGLSTKPQGDEGHKIARISAVRPMSFDYADYRYLKCSDDEATNYMLQEGDLIFTRYNGARRFVGVCAMFRGRQSRLFPDKLIQTRVDLQSIEPAFLEGALNSGESRSYIEGKIRTTAGQSGVSGGDIKTIPVPLCSLPEQLEIVRILDEQFAVIEQNEREIDAALARSEALRQAILKKAFSGQLVPQDPNDEPASALLDRIRAERAAGKTKQPPRKRGKSKSPTGGRTK